MSDPPNAIATVLGLLRAKEAKHGLHNTQKEF